ncbi:hypothetical protein GLAREA_02910 [Glarea lozoyensis ATCC 20868]|nr:uncharacterized protein GLAREA_02910 [Glarea lozoyensis ATCC 20868]EPE26996.1 hypothetical protein GLAREA_02910 [Glarea lozoyensis ATCC 20868]
MSAGQPSSPKKSGLDPYYQKSNVTEMANCYHPTRTPESVLAVAVNEEKLKKARTAVEAINKRDTDIKPEIIISLDHQDIVLEVVAASKKRLGQKFWDECDDPEVVGLKEAEKAILAQRRQEAVQKEEERIHKDEPDKSASGFARRSKSEDFIL